MGRGRKDGGTSKTISPAVSLSSSVTPLNASSVNPFFVRSCEISVCPSPVIEGVSTKLRRGPWWCHQIETFSALLAICAGNSPGPGEFPAQRPVTRSFDVFFDVRPNKQLSKQSWGWWFETLSPSLWRHRNARIGYNSWCWDLLRRLLVILKHDHFITH